jgi:hypothetical protein
VAAGRWLPAVAPTISSGPPPPPAASPGDPG